MNARKAEKLSCEDAVGASALLDFLSSQAAQDGPLRVAIVGVANVKFTLNLPNSPSQLT